MAFDTVAPSLAMHQKELVKQLIVGTLGQVKIPGIVRREDGKQIPDAIPVGFSSPFRIDGNRLRIAGFVQKKEVIQVVSPFEVIGQDFAPRTPCLKALVEILPLAAELKLKLGVWGSAALEIFTGLKYTDEVSDLDLLVGMNGIDRIRTFSDKLSEVAKEFHCNLDAELDLDVGYGVKVSELFMDSEMVLAKGLHEVIFLPRRAILDRMSEVQ